MLTYDYGGDSMRRGIITFHKANNLGAVLQAYALQIKLQELYKNDLVEIINYDNGYFKEQSHKKLFKGIAENIYYSIKNANFKKFRKKYLKLSKPYNQDSIIECNNVYDTFICGSDQIWNLQCSHGDYNYFLDFVSSSKNKISYAASLGNYSFNEDERNRVLKLLKDYRKISIRESESLKQFLGMETRIEIIPDPVFLLNQEEWRALIPKRIENKKYVFVYLIQDDINVMNSAVKYAKENNCIIISNKKSLKYIMNNSPLKFLSWIHYADAVFTNSFHGTAFSLIFSKRLGADIELKDGKTNNRISELLLSTKNEKCIINKEKYHAFQPTNYTTITNLRKKGINYLKNID